MPTVLLDCPECGHRVSDRAVACPSCGFPVSEHVANARHDAQLTDERSSRRAVGEVDCVHCEARGYRMFDFTSVEGDIRTGFEWCSICEHTGRVVLCESTTGFYAVQATRLDAYLSGAVDHDETAIVALGTEAPTGQRFPKPVR